MVEFFVKQAFALIGEAPARAVARTVFTGRGSDLFRHLFFVDELGVFRPVVLVREDDANIRRVTWVEGHLLQVDIHD